MALEYKLGSIVMMKKEHPCGSNEWEITRVGADIKIKCLNCGRSIMLSRIDFNKKIKKLFRNSKQSFPYFRTSKTSKHPCKYASSAVSSTNARH